jgi:hypothetical protein
MYCKGSLVAGFRMEMTNNGIFDSPSSSSSLIALTVSLVSSGLANLTVVSWPYMLGGEQSKQMKKSNK